LIGQQYTWLTKGALQEGDTVPSPGFSSSPSSFLAGARTMLLGDLGEEVGQPDNHPAPDGKTSSHHPAHGDHRHVSPSQVALQSASLLFAVSL
jgi:hypothetical protein